MNKVQFVSKVYNVLRDNDVRKSVPLKKVVFHIFDNNGNDAEFAIKQDDKQVLFTTEDVNNIVDACCAVIEDALCRGEEISIRGYGTIGVHKRAPRAVKQVGTDTWTKVEGRYVPKFTFGNLLRVAARRYEKTLEDAEDAENNAPYLYPSEQDGNA